MRTIYIMDNEMPIPKNYSSINTFEDVKEKDILELNTSYTSSVLDWAKNEFQKMFKRINVQSKFYFDDVLIAFFQSYFNTPEAFFYSEKNLLAVKIESYNTGAESNIQKSTIHELTHAATSVHSLVGVAVAEGIAIYVEDLYCKTNDIPFDDEFERDEGYIFGKNLIDSILLNVYNNDLNLFFDRIKRGNEEKFLNDIDGYLKSKNILYNARELLRLSSILFYAKKIPNSPFEDYKKSSEMEILRNEILDCFNNENKDTNLVIYEYLNSIKYVSALNDILKNCLSNFETISTTLDRELGFAIVQNGGSILLDNQAVINIIKKTFDIVSINGFDYDMLLRDISTSYLRR